MLGAARLAPAELDRMSAAARESVKMHSIGDGVDLFVESSVRAIRDWKRECSAGAV